MLIREFPLDTIISDSKITERFEMTNPITAATVSGHITGKVEESRPRRYYRISRQGRELLPRLAAGWQSLVAVMDSLLENVEAT